MAFVVPALTALGGGSAFAGGIVAAGAAAGVVGTVRSGQAARRAARAEQQAQEVQTRRQRRAAIRSNILASARAKASAQAAGTSQSSGLSGATGAGRSQLGSELGFGSQLSGLSANISKFNMQAQTYGDIAKFGFSAAGNAPALGGYAEDLYGFFKK